MSSKMREALEEVESILSTWIDHLPPVIQEKAQEAIDKAEAALAEPLRNCDVGTVDEQYARWDKHCQSMENRCSECSLHKNYFDLTAECYAKWSLMPYEEVK